MSDADKPVATKFLWEASDTPSKEWPLTSKGRGRMAPERKGEFHNRHSWKWVSGVMLHYRTVVFNVFRQLKTNKRVVWL